jgi:hypothetical protein
MQYQLWHVEGRAVRGEERRGWGAQRRERRRWDGRVRVGWFIPFDHSTKFTWGIRCTGMLRSNTVRNNTHPVSGAFLASTRGQTRDGTSLYAAASSLIHCIPVSTSC